MVRKAGMVVSFFLFVALASETLPQPRETRKSNVRPQELQITMVNVFASIGFEMPSFGQDPCNRPARTMGGMKTKVQSATQTTGLATKPTISVGRQGQTMEGEEGSRESERNQIIDDLDQAMNDFLNNNTESAHQHVANAERINDERTKRDMEAVKNASDPSKEQLDNLMEDIHCGNVIGRQEEYLNREAMKIYAEGMIRSSTVPEESKTFWRKVAENPNPENVSCDSPPCSEVRKAAEKMGGYLDEYKKSKQAKIGRGGLIGGKISSQGPTSTTTWPGQATRSGFEREKESKMKKRGTVSTPSESSGGAGGRSIDMCGRHLPTPAEAAAMGFNPMKITDPASDWTGRIEQKGTNKTLTWSKSAVNRRGKTVRVEHTYKDGSLVSSLYEVFDRSGKRIGTALYDAKTGSITAKRFNK